MERKNEIFENPNIEQMIITVRGKQVILDRELAKLYEVEISQMNRQVKRNIERFPEDFMFQLCAEEWASFLTLSLRHPNQRFSQSSVSMR